MPKVKLKKGKGKSMEQIFLPNVGQVMEHMSFENIMFFGRTQIRSKLYRSFLAFGYVKQIVHGENYDSLFLNCTFKQGNHRQFIVIDNISRRQLLTLERGMPCMVYGISRNIIKWESNEYFDKKVKHPEYVFYVRGIWGAYVPKGVNIKRYNYKENDSFREMSNQELKHIEKLIAGENDDE